MSERRADPMAPWSLMKKGMNVNSRSPSDNFRLSQGLRVCAATPSSAAASIRSLCFHETASIASPVCSEIPAATALRFRWASGSTDPLSMRAIVIGK